MSEQVVCAANIPSSYTCYSLSDLKKIAKAYNKSLTPYEKIDYATMSKRELWGALHIAVKDICHKSDKCLLTLPSTKAYLNTAEIASRTFAPPSLRDLFLYDDEIYNVMEQLQRQYRTFISIGPVAADIRLLLSSNNKPSTLIEKLVRTGYRSIGIVFNLDVHTGEGTHWISVFIDLSTFNHKSKSHRVTIEYYNSYGTPPSGHIHTWLKKIKQSIENTLDATVVIIHNPINHQRNDEYNCGVYAINYILRRLQGMSFQDVTKYDWTPTLIQKIKKELFI